LDPAIKIDLEIGDRAIDLLVKGDAIELIRASLRKPANCLKSSDDGQFPIILSGSLKTSASAIGRYSTLAR
jgi:hypothetical protein